MDIRCRTGCLKHSNVIEVPPVLRRGFFCMTCDPKDGREPQLLYNESQEVGIR